MLLVVNCGSSSVKLMVFDGAAEFGRAAAEVAAGGHQAALAQALAQLPVGVGQMRAAAHRVVHGGAGLIDARRLDAEVMAVIRGYADLAPLHIPANLLGIAAVTALAPDLPQYASFDTAFHATNPAEAVSYALPLAERQRGLRRYGFHGLSFAAIVRNLQETGGFGLPDRLLAFHLGNGASICAIRDGRSVATTMGYSPLDGLTMGTRPGGLDPAVVMDLCARHGVAGAGQILNRESGLAGLGGSSDMRALHAAGTPEAAFAVTHFCYWAVRHAGSMIAAMGGLDGVVFTGGIGENDPEVRGRILAGLDWIAAGKPVHVLPADEERQIALEAYRVMEAEE